MPLLPTQRRPLLIGLGLILAAALVVTIIWAGTYLPGFLGDVFSVLAGIMWTPVLLDISLFILGFMFIMWLNAYRRKREGDEFVYLEQIEGPGIPADMPPEARSAVFRNAPESLGDRPTIAAIEGALELDDLAAATELLMELPSEDIDTPEVLALRLQLARRQDRSDEAAELEKMLRLKSPHHPLCSPQE